MTEQTKTTVYGTFVVYDWAAIEKKLRDAGVLEPGTPLDRAKHLQEFDLPAETRHYRVTATGPTEVTPLSVYAVDESAAIADLVKVAGLVDQSHRYRFVAVDVAQEQIALEHDGTPAADEHDDQPPMEEPTE